MPNGGHADIAHQTAHFGLTLGYKVRYCVLVHAAVIAAGIVLIHSSNGWFVVGHGSNGMEYSVLILAVLAFTYACSSEEVADDVIYAEATE